MSNEDFIHEMNGAIGSGDVESFTGRMEPDVVWEHNIGTGSPEEGVYTGREDVASLFARVLEGWEFLHPEATEIRELEPGIYEVRGDLHCKHRATESVLVERYEQRLEIRDGLLARGRMTVGTTTHGESANVATVRRFMDAFNRLDIENALVDADADIVLQEWVEAPGAQTYHGHDGLRKAIKTWLETWAWMQVEIKDIADLGDRVVVTLYQRAKGSGSGIEVETDHLQRLHVPGRKGDAHRALHPARACARGGRTDLQLREGEAMSRFEDPVIITCSISGAVANREQCPAIPYTAEEYAAEARRIVDEGGAMIHIHARTPEGTPSYEIEDFRNITDAILTEVGDVIVNYSTGAVGVPIEKRLEYLRELRPEVGALNMGSMNYAKYSKRRKQFVFHTVFENSFETIITFLNAMNELGIKPEHECFDSGHIANLDPLLDMGLLREPLQVSCVMGVTGGIRPNARNLAHMSEQIPGGAEGLNNWGVIGISRDQWRLGAAALTLGGNFRVGLEDNFYLPDGEMARSNGDLIAKARQMVEDTGRRVATIEEARVMLGTRKMKWPPEPAAATVA